MYRVASRSLSNSAAKPGDKAHRAVGWNIATGSGWQLKRVLMRNETWALWVFFKQ